MKRLFAEATFLFVLLIAAFSGYWLWAGWRVEIDGASVSMTMPSLLLIVSLALVVGTLIVGRVRTADAPVQAETTREIQRRPSLEFTVKQGKRYKAQILLGFFQQVASNEMIAGMFQKAGFANVLVTGSGVVRYAEGQWSGADATAEMPAQSRRWAEPLGNS